MKLIKKIIYWKLSLQFYFITFLRNKFYDFGFLKSYSFDIPVISVGNLTVGGTGKTPMVEFLINHFSEKYNIGVLSRGYKRKSKGFILASDKDDADSIGDEPFQYYSKFKNITVAVDKKRKRGINKLIEHGVNLIILDDAFQHRKVIPSYSILLSDYSNLYYNDYLMPRGTLRESIMGYKRADSIIITKCPTNLSEKDKYSIKSLIKPTEKQNIFFSTIKYSDKLFSSTNSISISKLTGKKVNLVTGIVNSKPLIKFLKNNGLDVNHFEYADHHDYLEKDITDFSGPLIITTEKDYAKLRKFDIENLYYLPINMDILESDEFFEVLADKIID